MPEGSTINAAQLFSDDSSEILMDAGVPHFNRRLTDKILGAFNHAYALGEMEVARALWDCLIASEKLSHNQDARRRPNQAIDLASEWVAFVDARDRYRDLTQNRINPPAEAAEAFQTMKAAYARWRERNATS